MNKYKLSELIIYPVKSLGGINLTEAEVTERGLKYDRRWMLIDNKGKFITQRVYPQMSMINVFLEKDSLLFTHKTDRHLSFSIPINSDNSENEKVIIWDDAVDAVFVNKEADDWFSSVLKINCRLVHMPEESRRLVDKKYASKNEIVSFADGYPFLLIGQSSLDDLNTRLDTKLPMNRFRPNLVFTGGSPFDEDKMKSFTLSGIKYYPVKPCARCVLTTIDQETGNKGAEPLNTLAKYRTLNNKVMFGQNVLHEGVGKINVGCQLENIEWT